MIILSAASTALILIDLQKGIVGMPTAPYSGEAVLAKGKELARRFRAARAPVRLVNVAFSLDFGDALKMPVDRPPPLPPGGLPEGWTELADGLAEPSDLRITAPMGRIPWHRIGPAAPPPRGDLGGDLRDSNQYRRGVDRPDGA